MHCVYTARAVITQGLVWKFPCTILLSIFSFIHAVIHSDRDGESGTRRLGSVARFQVCCALLHGAPVLLLALLSSLPNYALSGSHSNPYDGVGLPFSETSLCLCLSVCLSVSVSLCLCHCLSLGLSVSGCLCVCLCLVCLSACLPACLPQCLSVCLSLSLSLCLSLSLSLSLFSFSYCLISFRKGVIQLISGAPVQVAIVSPMLKQRLRGLFLICNNNNNNNKIHTTTHNSNKTRTTAKSKHS